MFFFFNYLKYVIKLNNYINNNNNNNVFVVEIHGEKFIKFKILKITHQEKDIKLNSKIIILKC